MNINELETYNLADAVKFHSELNPRLWHNEQLRPEVEQQLRAIADDFRQFLGIRDLDVQDITISGSNAAYTYTPHSDIDLHLVVNLDEVCDSEVYRELFDAKKYQYNDEHNYKIGGYDVELYVQDATQPHHSQGIYSLINNKWIRVPNRRHPTVDDISVKSKYEDLGNRIEQALKSGNIDAIKNLWDKVKTMRKTGLADSGEFGPENLTFKLLRRHGLLEKLKTAVNQARDQELSLRETQPEKKKIYGYKNYWFPGYDYYANLTANVDQPSEVEESAQVTVKGKTHPLEQVVEKFVKFCANHLHLKTIPTINLMSDPRFGTKMRTMGHYMDDKRTIEVEVNGRHILDIMRTIAHELVHYSQHERDDLPADAGDTGSPWENEAHATAGVLMRYFDRAHPEYFKAKVIDEGIRDRLAAAAAAACIAGTPGCATTSDAVRGVQAAGTAAQTVKRLGRAGAEEEMMQRLKNELRRRQGQVVPEGVTDEDYDPNGMPPGPEFKPTMPAGTVKVDVSDTYDWYKLGQHISNLKGLGQHDFGKGPPSTIMAFGSEEEEHKYIDALMKTGLTTTDIDPVDPNQPKGMPRQKTDPTYNVNEATGYIPVNDREARDPRYSMAITQDIKPGEVQRQAAKMGFKTDAAGIPPLLMKLQNQLKEIKTGTAQ